MTREEFITTLRAEIADVVADRLTPIAKEYGYSEVPLETNIKWKPMVLVIGNYSSGKSSLINEFLGAEIQATGQAPTDDSFTVITYGNSDGGDPNTVRVTDERDGKAILNEPEYPFSTLRRQGQRFASHFRLKKVNSPILKDLAIIDTPGMLDSVTERDRGYDYQEILGDLAQKADMVMVLFDAHKAGTVQEAYKSIRETLATHTSEDRVLFVLNRIDECNSLDDLLRVFGTLCWNLSQTTGRKDIPPIHLTYSTHMLPSSEGSAQTSNPFLPLLENQREQLKRAISRTPMRRLDHLATFVENQGERLIHYMEALLAYRKSARAYRVRLTILGLILSLVCGTATAGIMLSAGIPALELLGGAGAAVAVGVMVLWMTTIQGILERKRHQKQLEDLDNLTDLEEQTQKDTWMAIRDIVHKHLRKNEGKYSLFELKRDLNLVRRTHEDATREIREALSDLANLSEVEFQDIVTPILSANRQPDRLTVDFDGNEALRYFRYMY
ncbi:MAG: dynamin family protein [Thermodesulfobacteriota bacterium]